MVGNAQTDIGCQPSLIENLHFSVREGLTDLWVAVSAPQGSDAAAPGDSGGPIFWADGLGERLTAIQSSRVEIESTEEVLALAVPVDLSWAWVVGITGYNEGGTK